MNSATRSVILTSLTDLIEQSIVTDGRIDIEYIVQEEVSTWTIPEGPDTDKLYLAARAFVRDLVRGLARKQQSADEESSQLDLPNFPILHRWYPVGGKLVVTNHLSVSEALDVLADLERTEAGIRLHKEELRRFIDEVLIPRERSG